MTDLYTVDLTVTDGNTYNFTRVDANSANDCVTAFLGQAGECGFTTANGYYAWPWYDITSCKVTRQP